MSRKKAKRRLVKAAIKWAKQFGKDFDDIVRCDEDLVNAVAEYKRAKRDKR